MIDEAMEKDELPPYFPYSHREGIDLINVSMSKLDAEIKK